MKFKTYIESWFKDLLKEHKDDKKWLQDVAKELNIEDVDNLQDATEKQIYTAFFGYNTKSGAAALAGITTYDFLLKCYSKYADKLMVDYNFAGFVVDSLAYYSAQYDYPEEFFYDLARGGMAAGTVGEFIYWEDCQKFFNSHADDIVRYLEDNELMGGLEEYANNPWSTRAVWCTYMAFAMDLANALWPEDF